MTLLAVAFADEDGSFLNGDSSFYTDIEDTLKAEEGETFGDLLTRWIEHWKSDNPGQELCPEDSDPTLPDGFWVIEEEKLLRALEIWDDMDPHDDGTTYACNRAAKKRIARESTSTLLSPKFAGTEMR